MQVTWIALVMQRVEYLVRGRASCRQFCARAIHGLAWICTGMGLSGIVHAQPGEFDLEFAFNDKPPLFYFAGAEARGEVVEIVKRACVQAALRCSYRALPFLRIMAELEHRRPRFAALGFSRTPERERFAVFSEPVFRDEDPILLVRSADLSAFKTYPTFAAMVGKSHYVFGGKAGNVYPIDATLSGMGRRDQRFIGEATHLPRLLLAHRFDFTILYPQELPFALQASAVNQDALATLTYPDLPKGEERFILFSQTVSPAVMQRFNAALIAMGAAAKKVRK